MRAAALTLARRLALRLALLALLGLSALPAPAPAADHLSEARRLLLEAKQALMAAQGGEARLSAIGRAVRAQEAALDAIRSAIRRLHAEQAEIARSLDGEQDRLGEVLAALQARAGAPASALLAWPSDPLDAARAAAMLADVTPVIRERMARLADRLERLDRLAARQDEAEREARLALAALQDLRAEGAEALSGRRHPSATQSERLAAQAEAAARTADTLAALAEALAAAAPGGPALGFEQARGDLALPVVGRVTSRLGEPDPLGREGAGWTVEAPAFAQVSAPWDGTVRYAGPLGRYGNVMVLEPESGYLMVLAGLGRVDREVGEVVLAGEKLGDMGGPLPGADEFLFDAATDDDLIGRENLYLELRHRGEPLDPAAWFDEQARQG